jgi:hypothetical protein
MPNHDVLNFMKDELPENKTKKLHFKLANFSIFKDKIWQIFYSRPS